MVGITIQMLNSRNTIKQEVNAELAFSQIIVISFEILKLHITLCLLNI